MLNRRHFIQVLAVAASAPAHSTVDTRGSGFGKLLPDRARVLDLPEGFDYRIISRAGTDMSDGLIVPGYADGMAAFPGENGLVRLVCNHENAPYEQHSSPFGLKHDRLNRFQQELIYDNAPGTPGAGGTTTIVYDPLKRETVRQFLSLAGTELNCAGGPTPWNSWLTCEETFSDPGPAWENATVVHRNERHGYVFEVSAASNGPVEPVPLKAMGRFEHEAAAVDPASGVVYMTEDKHRSLFYRFIPKVSGDLQQGGQLQALAIASHDSYDTRNWSEKRDLEVGQWHDVRWIDIPDPDTDTNDLRLRGFEDGAARFARGEGLCFADGSAFFTCTIGGPERLGQVFEYRVSSHEGLATESESPGRLRLLAESDRESVLRNADNVTMSPWGDLVVCEDTADHCGLVGVRRDGTQYAIADNAYSDSELAGICFSPDGRTMFVNIQYPGMTLAINGPWPDLS